MAEEPSNGELGRRLDLITALLQDLVGTREYLEFQRHVNHRLTGLDADITDERKAREANLKEVRAEQAAGRQTARTALYTALGTLLAGVVLAALTTYVKLGGH